jgi:hypothetical protein
MTNMKRFFVLALMACAPAMAADVAVSVTVGDPRFFGRLEIGSFPQPRLIFPKPVVVQVVPVGVVREPMYLRVPPGHEKHWSKHCAEYNACGHPVYFVEDRWYNDVYVPEYKARHGHGEHGDHDDHGDHEGKDHGHGNGKGKGHGND